MSKLWENKTKPHIRYRTVGDVFSEETVHEYSASLMMAKHKGKVERTYTDKGFVAVASTSELPRNRVIETLAREAEEVRRKGRYFDWFFAPKPSGNFTLEALANTPRLERKQR